MAARTRVFGPNALATPANAVSLIRLSMSPVMVALVVGLAPSWGLVALWIALAGTDGVDGWIARRQGTTRSGAFLDPLADKCLVLGALAALASRSILPWVPVVLIALRELGMSLYRSVAGMKGRSIPSKKMAKAKTWLQVLVVAAALVPTASGAFHDAVEDMLWVAVALTLGSALQYWAARNQPS
jgi:CDP-diacylglycerol---glycerol-3-phosphate 3-phosphatidyltransferase